MAYHTLESLKGAVLEQAAAKGFGTSPGEISVPEKLLLIGSEITETYQAHVERRRTIDDAAAFGETYRSIKHDPQLLLTQGREGLDIAVQAFNLREHYREEWADVLQRTRQLAGIFGVIFRDTAPAVIPAGAPDIVSIPPPWDNRRYLELHNWIQDIYRRYRKKDLEGFKQHLAYLGPYLVHVAMREEFDIFAELEKKITKNAGRTWDPAKLNEQFVKP